MSVSGRLLILAGALAAMPTLLSSAFVNLGSYRFASAILADVSGASAYPHWQIPSDPADTEAALRAFETALFLARGNRAASWGYARASLATGDARGAASALSSDGWCVQRNTLCLLDALEAHSRAGDDQAVESLSAQLPASVPHTLPSEALSLTYLARARARMEAGDQTGADGVLQDLLRIRPYDLYANYHLWRHLRASPYAAEERYRARLVQFPIEAVSPFDDRLIGYALDTFCDLRSAGIWDAAQGSHLLSYWVWKYSASPVFRTHLEALARACPGYDQYVAESSRRANWVSAMVSQRERDAEHGAAAAPAALAILSRMLSVSAASMTLMPNLAPLPNGQSISQTAAPTWFYATAGGVHNWVYAAGQDSFERPGAVRIVNLWWPAEDRESGYTPYAFYHSAPRAVSTEWFTATLSYKLAGGRATGAVLISATSSRGHVTTIATVHLDDTGGAWRQVVVAGRVPDASARLAVTIGSWGAASVTFSDVAIRGVVLATSSGSCVDGPCVYLERPPTK